MTGWILVLVLMLPATPPATTPATAMVPDGSPPAHEPIMAIPSELQARLHDEVLARPGSRRERLQRLIAFVSDPSGLGLAYRQDATYTVEQAYATRQVNCLSFTLMFVALAREAGLDAYPQVIEETLAWHQSGGTIFRNNHINAGVRIAGRIYTVDVASEAVIARQPPAPASDERMRSLYYNNQAMVQLAAGRIAPALADMVTALELDPAYPAHWSNLGVVYLHRGDMGKAEDAYSHALSLDPVHAGALFNLMSLHGRTGDRKREAEFRRRLERVQHRDPFHHVLLAIGFEKDGDYRRAVSHYRRAIRLYPDEHRFHFRLAMAYAQLGDLRRASRVLIRAQALSDGPTRDLYQASLDGLVKPPDATR